eukprot:gene26118-34727_t
MTYQALLVHALKNAGPHWPELEDLVAQYEAIKGAAYSHTASFVVKNADGAVIDVLASSPTPPPADGCRLGCACAVGIKSARSLKNVPSDVSSIVPVFITNRRLRSGSIMDPAKAFGVLLDPADCKKKAPAAKKEEERWSSVVRRSDFIPQNSFPSCFGSALGTTTLLFSSQTRSEKEVK